MEDKEKNKQSSRTKVIAIGCGILGLVAIIFGTVLFFSNYRVVMRAQVCGNDIVARYNDILDSGDENWIGNLKNLVDEVMAKSRAETDANCRYMSLMYAIYAQDKPLADSELTKYTNAISSGGGVNAEFRDLRSLRAIGFQVEYLNLEMTEVNGSQSTGGE